MLIKVAESELKRLANKTRFILAVVEGSLVVNRKKKAELVEELEMMMYDKLPKTKTSASAAAAIVQTDENDIAADESDDANASYDYLLSMPLWNLTLEKVEELVKEKEEKEAEVASLRETTEKDLWFKDLDALEENLDQLEDDDAAAEEEMQKQVRAAARNNTKAGQKALAKKKKAIKKKAMDWDSDASESEFDDDFSDDDFEITKPKKRAPAKKKKAADSDSDVSFDDDEDVVADVAPKPARAGRNVQRKSYKVDDSSDEEEESDFEDGDDDDDDDFDDSDFE